MSFELYLVTFNCARTLVNPEFLAPSLFDAFASANPASLPDVVAISLEEVAPIAYSFLGGSYLTPYLERVEATVQLAARLRSNDGSEVLEHVATRNLGMTALMLFAKPKFIRRVKWMQSAGAGVGLWNMGNKGAVGLRLAMDNSTTLTLTAAHLAPMELRVQDRNLDWENIVRNLVFVNDNDLGYLSGEEQPLLSSTEETPEDGKGLYLEHTESFFAGDLNYRTRDHPPDPKSHLKYPQPISSESDSLHFSNWLKDDQLTRERTANRTLHGFQEQPITFPPTYKIAHRHKQYAVPGKRANERYEEEDTWRWAKHRYPSWCDRILYLQPSHPSSIHPHKYIALPIQPTSDHRPVALSVTLKLGDGKTAAGDVRLNPPFPINPYWKARKEAARRLEVIVGVLSYLALTKRGNAIVVAVAGVVFAGWYTGSWIAGR